jgi:hypothetical protein
MLGNTEHIVFFGGGCPGFECWIYRERELSPKPCQRACTACHGEILNAQ